MEPLPTASSIGNDGGSKARVCNHSDHNTHSQDAGGWVRSLAVATFDVGTGHTLEQVYPPESLDEGDRQQIRMLAMPDCNTTQMGDCFYCFRTRKSHRLPLLSSSLLDQAFEYCYAFFRQEKNKECARGMFQKSVVLVSRYPYVNLFERLVKVIGPLYFAHGPAVLEAVFASLEEWPAPCPGALCPLPFLSETVMFQVPEIDMPPQVASKYRYHRGAHTCSLWPRARIRSLARTMSGCGSMDFPNSTSSPRMRQLSSVFSPAFSSAVVGDNSNPLYGDPRAFGCAACEDATSVGGGSSKTASKNEGREDTGAWDEEVPPIGCPVRSDDSRSTAEPSNASETLTSGIKNGLTTSRGSAGGTEVDGVDDPHTASRPIPDCDAEEAVSVWQSQDEIAGPRTLSGDAEGGSPRGQRGFWSGSARSPGLLIPPGLQQQTEAFNASMRGSVGNEIMLQRRSSLGSGSLASVVSNSPSESWLTTPKSARSPLVVLDSSCGSNLAQSCYYVADRDSEEDDEMAEEGNEVAEESDDMEDDPGGEPGAGEVAGAGEPPGAKPLEGRGDEDTDSAGFDPTTRAGRRVEDGATQRSPKKTTPRKLSPARGRGSTSPRCVAGSPKATTVGIEPKSASVSTHVAEAIVQMRSSPQPSARSPTLRESSNVKSPSLKQKVLSPRRSRAAGTLMQNNDTDRTACRGREGARSLSPARRAFMRGQKLEPFSSSTAPDSGSRVSLICEPPHMLRAKTATPPKTCPKIGAWAGLRAWADAASDDPLDAPPPLNSPLMSRSGSMVSSPNIVKRAWGGAVTSSPNPAEAESAIGSNPMVSSGSRRRGAGVNGAVLAEAAEKVSKFGLEEGETEPANRKQENKLRSPSPPTSMSPSATRVSRSGDPASAGKSAKGATPRETPKVRHRTSPGSNSPLLEVYSEGRSDTKDLARERRVGRRKSLGDGVAQAAGGVLELVVKDDRMNVGSAFRPSGTETSPARMVAREQDQERPEAPTVVAVHSVADSKTIDDGINDGGISVLGVRIFDVKSSRLAEEPAPMWTASKGKRASSSGAASDSSESSRRRDADVTVSPQREANASRCPQASPHHDSRVDSSSDSKTGASAIRKTGDTAKHDTARGSNSVTADSLIRKTGDNAVRPVPGTGSGSGSGSGNAVSAKPDHKSEYDGDNTTLRSMVADGTGEGGSGKVETVVASKVPLARKRSFRLGSDGRPASWKANHDKSSIHIHHTASTLQGGRSPFAEMLLADEARFRAKQGLFQSIGLYSVFGKKLVEHLWLLWELVLTGGPTLVVGSNVGASSAAILGMVSLASPVYFAGDFRPHFTTFDPDYQEMVAAHDRLSKQQLWGSSVLGVSGAGSAVDATGGFPSMLLGVINPIFLRSLSRWPNAIVLPGAAGRNSAVNGSSSSVAAFKKVQRLHKEHSEESKMGSPRNRHCPKPMIEGGSPSRPPPVRVQVIRPGASLEHIVGQDERPDEPIIVCRQQPVMVPDVGVLSRLLDPGCPYNPATAAAAVAAAATADSSPAGGSSGLPASSSSPTTPSSAGVAAMAAKAAAAARGGLETKGQWKDSLRAINDVILRRHFADLTRSFLAPFDKFFRPVRPPPHLSAWQQQALTRLSVYTEAELLLCKFDGEEFLAEMSMFGPPKSFAYVQWQTLYRRFMDSPNFRPWFTTQRIEGVERIREFNRSVCLRTSAAALVEACAPAKLQTLLTKIKRAIAREWGVHGTAIDWELLERMEMHQAAVEAASSTPNGAAGPTGSAQP